MKISINMATIPSRKIGFEARLNELAPQCDIFRVYLNGYSEWPFDIPLYENVEYVCGNKIDAPDMGSQGKLSFIDPMREEYYLTVDDDIYYPPDYVEKIIQGSDLFYKKAIVGFHGIEYKIKNGCSLPIETWNTQTRKMYMYSEQLPHQKVVHQLGNATMCCVPCELGLTKDVIGGPINSGDDSDMAIWAQQHNVPMVILRRYRNWLMPDNRVNTIDAQHRQQGRRVMERDKLHAVQRWNLPTMPKSKLK